MECTNLKNIILELQGAATQVEEEQVVLDLQQEDSPTDFCIWDFR